ncbi:MAG: molybdopterin-guanine dinucleotide biosynthesis protein B [Candidatus Anammoxibacter sp.]
MKIISIIGKSGSGKTTLIERLIPELAKRHCKVATVKHDAHNFEVDKVGKDSWRHKNAGAKTTVVSSATKIAIFTDAEKDNSLESICEKYISGVDIILTEGYRMSKYPKIEVVSSTNDKLLCGESDNLIAIVGDCEFDRDVPVFKHDDIAEITDMIYRLA